MLRYCHENGCPWNMPSYSDGGICDYAITSGNLEVLRYCHAELRSENGCPWNSNTCYYAGKSDNLEILRYCHENGCLWYANTCAAAAACGSLRQPAAKSLP